MINFIKYNICKYLLIILNIFIYVVLITLSPIIELNIFINC